MYCEAFSLWLLRRLFLALCEFWRVFHLLLSCGSFPSLGCFPHMDALPTSQMKAWGRETLWRFLQFSLRAAVSSPVFCPVNSTHHSLFELSTLSSQRREIWGLFLGFPSQSCSLKFSMQWAWALIGFTSFLVLSQGSWSFATFCPVSEKCYFLYL